MQQTEQTDVTCIWEVVYSNFGLNTGCPDWIFPWFSSFPPGKFRIVPRLNHDRFPHHASYRRRYTIWGTVSDVKQTTKKDWNARNAYKQWKQSMLLVSYVCGRERVYLSVWVWEGRSVWECVTFGRCGRNKVWRRIFEQERRSNQGKENITQGTVSCFASLPTSF
jgi:hypothetical protein